MSNRMKNRNDANRHESFGKRSISPPSHNQALNGYHPTNGLTQNGDCVLCKRNAVCVCQRCGDFYCSPECQRKDWHGHRYICFPMPSLVRAASYASSVAEPTIPLLSASNLNSSNEMQQEVLRNMLNIPAHQPDGKTQVQSRANASQEHNNMGRQRQPLNATYKTPVSCLQPPTSPFPKHNSRVQLTGFRSPNRCYVRSLSTAELDGFMRVAKAIDSYGKTAPRLNVMPQANTYAITHLDPNGIMYRVQVLAARPGAGIRVLFLDNGATAVRQLADLREISEDILRLQQHSVQVQLKNVENYAINEKLMGYLSQFEDMEFRIQYSKEDDGRGSNVVLRHWKNDESLNDQIIEFGANMNIFSDTGSRKNDSVSSGAVGHKESSSTEDKSDRFQAAKNTQQSSKGQNTTPKTGEAIVKPDSSSSSSDAAVMIAPFVMRTFKENDENLEVIVLDNSCLELGYFGCVSYHDVTLFSQVQKYLAAFTDTKKSYSPRVNEYCIAKFEGDWYRAKVTGIPSENQYSVLYIDYTNESTISSTDIRKYPQDLRFDCSTNMCLIEGLPADINKTLFKYLQEKLPLNTMIKINKVKSVDEQIVVVELDWLIQKLQKDGHI